jgi:hypothetical protein
MTTKILTNWQPSTLDRETIRREFRELVAGELSVSLDSVNMTRHEQGDVREPKWQVPMGWHRDEGINHQVDMSVVIWSNIKPTEVRFPDGSLLEARDGDVILIDNLECEHRTPEGDLSGRWFARARVAKGER